MALSPARNGHPTTLPDVKTYARIPQVLDVPNLIQSQIQSWDWFKADGLKEDIKKSRRLQTTPVKSTNFTFWSTTSEEAKYSTQG